MKGEQKVIITKDTDEINDYLKDGEWKVISVSSQHVSTANQYANIVEGNFCFLIEKQ